MIDIPQSSQPESNNDDESSIRLIAIRDVAELLSCSPRHVQRLCDAAQMPAPVKLGGHLTRWNLAELQKWIQQGCPESGTDHAVSPVNHPLFANSDEVSP